VTQGRGGFPPAFLASVGLAQQEEHMLGVRGGVWGGVGRGHDTGTFTTGRGPRSREKIESWDMGDTCSETLILILVFVCLLAGTLHLKPRPQSFCF
jgi:hypothetical protein